ncbi:MAG: 23S rRNA (pseudouridine(1915)-N(3))-methyltransferase RlmH [Firmicutes bacterium]|nr:23S rRNA (pseudouridine(1915)-N(3))-methyltransferase RlmH [Bacillota bacterium]
MAAGNREYLTRLQPYARVELITLPAAKIPPRLDAAAVAAIKDQEAQTILTDIKPNDYFIALSEDGQQLTSPKFAAMLQKLALAGHSRLAFVVGGTLGLGPAVFQRADTVLSLSSFTFTHELARLILLEQLYRAFKINANEPYHY